MDSPLHWRLTGFARQSYLPAMDIRLGICCKTESQNCSHYLQLFCKRYLVTLANKYHWEGTREVLNMPISQQVCIFQLIIIGAFLACRCQFTFRKAHMSGRRQEPGRRLGSGRSQVDKKAPWVKKAPGGQEGVVGQEGAGWSRKRRGSVRRWVTTRRLHDPRRCRSKRCKVTNHLPWLREAPGDQ